VKTAPYSREYSPAAPVLPAHIAVPGEAPEGDSMSALVDTGADGTFVPTSLLEDLDAPILYMTNVHSHFGERLHRVSVHAVDVILFGEVRLPGVEVVADDWGDRIILGRNVLNMLNLQLNGTHMTMRLLD
jgi:predicted aspartyl protease